MRTKALAITGIILAISLTGLCIPAFLAQREGLCSLLLIVPDGPASPRIDIQKIEEFSKKEFLISYEITGAQRLILPHAEFPVTVIGTTGSYSQMLGLAVIEGSFFSKQAWNGKLRHVVLNETAAHAIFGSGSISGLRFRMGNDNWLVSGVLRDGDEEHSRVYVPSSIRGGEASSFLALMQPASGIDEAYIKSSIKTLGIQEGNYCFFNLRVLTGLLWERVQVFLLVFLGLLFLSLLRPLAFKFTSALAALKAGMEHHYMGEILRKRPKLIVKPAFLALGLFLFATAALFLFLRAASMILPWQDLPSLSALNQEFFYPHLLRLRNFESASRFLFILCAAFLATFCVVFNIFLNRKKTDTAGTNPASA